MMGLIQEGGGMMGLIRLHATRRVLRALLVVVTLLSVLFMSAPPRASATTGDTYVLPPSRYKVPSSLYHLYRGRYSMESVAKGAKIIYASGFITVNNYHDLYGAMEFYGYDDQGMKNAWINLLYDFRLTQHRVMVIKLYGWGGPSLGMLFVTRTKRGDLVGQIQLLNGKKYPISFHKDSNKE